MTLRFPSLPLELWYFSGAVEHAALATSHTEPEIMTFFGCFLFTISLEASAKLVQILDNSESYATVTLLFCIIP